ncbi:hypothetical protein [Corynebacterium sp. A21]|uniref:hypothetical protein n=1 Tax=Corynebacterium sp. A21 TaxID=3457318 RepID=UPI003FD1E004
MATFFRVARPVPGEEPADVVRSFVFMANLAAQEVTGETGSSVSAARVIQRLAGSTESDSVMVVMAESSAGMWEVDPQTRLSLLPSTVAAGFTDLSSEYEYLGFIHLSVPLREDLAMVEMECVLDANFQPVPGERLSDEGRQVYQSLLNEGERLTRQLGRRIIQLWQTHPTTAEAGAESVAAELSAAGFRSDLVEVQGVIELFEVSRQVPGLPADVRIAYFDSHVLPSSHLEGVLDLLYQASLDVPHGQLYLEPQRWTPERLSEAEVRRRDTGLEVLYVVLSDDAGPVALSELHRHPASEPGTVEQGITVVLPRARGRGLGRSVKHLALIEVQERWTRAERVYASNGTDNPGMLAINRSLGMREISRGTAWQKILPRD